MNKKNAFLILIVTLISFCLSSSIPENIKIELKKDPSLSEKTDKFFNELFFQFIFWYLFKRDFSRFPYNEDILIDRQVMRLYLALSGNQLTILIHNAVNDSITNSLILNLAEGLLQHPSELPFDIGEYRTHIPRCKDLMNEMMNNKAGHLTEFIERDFNNQKNTLKTLHAFTQEEYLIDLARSFQVSQWYYAKFAVYQFASKLQGIGF